MLNVKIILGSTRPGRFSEKFVPWVQEGLAAHPEMQAEVLDLRDYPIPFYDDERSAAFIPDGSYKSDVVKSWAAKITEADAFIFITAEYNHGPTGVLKNALDAIYHEWAHKPVAFVGYGSVGGARAVEQLRAIVAELHMASVRTAVHIIAPWMLVDQTGALKEGVLAQNDQSRTDMLTQLQWWGDALKTARGV
jgi:NAD(P)H-dependent FMN reductase